MQKRLNDFFEISWNGVSIISDVENNFIKLESNIYKEYKSSYNKMNQIDMEKYLNSKFGVESVNNFFNKINKYSRFFFYDENLDNPQKKLFDIEKKSINTLNLIMTNLCNQKCKYCFEGKEFCGNSVNIMSQSIIDKVINIFINQLVDQGQIIFTGGEPLLNFNMIKHVVNICKEHCNKIFFTIKTNGTLLNDDMFDYIIKNNISVQISMDGCKLAHDCHRKFKSSDDSTFDKVETLIKKFKQVNYIDNICINGVVTHETIKYLNQSYFYLDSLIGIEKCSIKPVMSDLVEYKLDEKDYDIFLEYALKCQDKRNSVGIKENQSVNCGIGLTNISIDTKGDIYPCYRLAGIKQYYLGNVETSGFNFELPNSIKVLYTLDKNEKCKTCKSNSFCIKGCFADKLLNESIMTCKCAEKDIYEFAIKKLIIDTGLYTNLETI